VAWVCHEWIGMANPLLVDAAPSLEWIAPPTGRTEFVNLGWCEYTGLDVTQSLERGWESVIHRDDLPKALETARLTLTSGIASKIEARLRRHDGEYSRFLLRILPMRDHTHRIVRWCALNTETESPERTEDALYANALHFRSIFDSIPGLIALMSPAGELETVNRPLREYLGKILPELKDWADAIHPDDVSRVIPSWTHSVETGAPYNIEHRIRRADGVYRWFQVHGLPLRDNAGLVVRWHILLTDIDDRKRAEVLLAGEKRLLEMVASGQPLAQVLDAICLIMETTAGGCHCSVVLIDSSGTQLEHCAAPNLPRSFIASLVGRLVGVDSGPAAMAAFLNRQIIVPDLASDTRWDAHWRPIAMAHGVAACCSTPISSSAGRILGAFTIYYGTPCSPEARHQALIQRLTHIASIAIDRTQSDSALKRSEARKSAILDSSLDCIVTIDHEGRITEFNPAAERTFGYQRLEVLGRMLSDVIIPLPLRQAHQDGLARFLATGETRVLGKRVELSAMRADGSEFPVELAITRIAAEGPASFNGYLRDITERKRSEDELWRSEESLAQAQRLSSTGSFSWRVATDELRWSEQLYRIFEFASDTPMTFELIGSRVHPDDRPLLFDMIDRARGAAGGFEYEYRLLMPDHSVKYLHLVAHAEHDHDGQLEYFGAVQDVTPRRLSEEALSRARSELAYVARVTSLAALTASIAHEVTQPISGIMTNASTCLRMLSAKPPNLDGARETARRSIRDAHRASEVMTRLRALFSKKPPTAELMSLNDAIREVLALSQSELQRHRVMLRTELPDDLPLIRGDRVQLQQVVLNLVLNAVDAMTLVEDCPRRLLVRTESEDIDRICVMVQDSGVGFPSQGVERLFEPFYSTKANGMGIGLFVSRSIIDSHQGRLWATPNDDGGACFAFSIPRRTEDDTAGHAGDSPQPPGVLGTSPLQGAN